MSRFTMYHQDYAPQGRLYDDTTHDKAQLEREGWVDSVTKIDQTKWERNNPRGPDDETPD